MEAKFDRSDLEQMRAMAAYVAQLVKEEVTFEIKSDYGFFVVVLTGGY